ncbi:hypothetical protein G6F57_017336 [Rhizopus arrhizus]|nr:hypothetical protein G6F57_017336 [Rhizopus arrhizus]
MIVMEPALGVMEIAPMPAANRRFTTYRLDGDEPQDAIRRLADRHGAAHTADRCACRVHPGAPDPGRSGRADAGRLGGRGQPCRVARTTGPERQLADAVRHLGRTRAARRPGPIDCQPPAGDAADPGPFRGQRADRAASRSAGHAGGGAGRHVRRLAPRPHGRPGASGGRHAAAVAAGVLDGPAAAPALCAEAGLVSRRGFRGLQRKPRPRAAVPGVAGGHAVAA